MKKVVSLLTALLAVGTLMAQEPTIVSTSVEKRNVIIEEFTGINCGYCPDGHARANAICEQYAGHAWAINIHEGGFASGSGFTTEYGDQLATLWTISGYPCGTVNRTTLTDRGQWATTAATVRGEDSPVNVAATAEIDPNTRKLTVYVEAYFTADQTATTNLLNVALLQNNVIAYQSNYGNYNPDYIVDANAHTYRHMHMFRDFLTGQWGEEIATTKDGLIQKTYTYDIPASIGTLSINDFADLEVLAFVTEPSHKNILTACEAEMTILPAVYQCGFEVINNDCSLEYQPYITIANTTSKAASNFVIDFNGTNLTFADKTIAAGQQDTINLPLYTVTFDNTVEKDVVAATTDMVKLVSYDNDEGTQTPESSTMTATYGAIEVYNVAGPFTLRYGIDHYASEGTLALLDQSTCTEVWKDGPWTDRPGSVQSISQLKPARYFSIQFNPAAGLYILRATDSYGDGWCYTTESEPAGMWLSNEAGEILGFSSYINNQGYIMGTTFSQLDYYLNVTSDGDGSMSKTAINDVVNVNFGIYPNPVADRVFVESSEPVSLIEVIDINGRTVKSQGAASSIATSDLASGVYILRVTTESGVGTQKFVKE